MPDQFKQTVNLKARAEAQREALVGEKAEPKPPRQAPLDQASLDRARSRRDKQKRIKKVRSRAKAIDQVYGDEPVEEAKSNNFQNIERPAERPSYEGLYKRITIALAMILFGVIAYWLIWGFDPGNEPVVQTEGVTSWYMIELVNKEVYYGQIKDKTADPIQINNVYYNYEQLNPENKEDTENSNLRLIKRGKETYGPSGTMYIYQGQIGKIDELSKSSKVLKAILDYEK